MKTSVTLLALTASLCACSASTLPHPPVGPKGELWLAASRTASSITGNIRLSNSSLATAWAILPLRAEGLLPAWRANDRNIVPARLFEVIRPARLSLRNGNAFGCAEPVRWIVTWRSEDGRDLNMNTYTGRVKPRSAWAPSSRPDRSPQLCATYLYTRPNRD